MNFSASRFVARLTLWASVLFVVFTAAASAATDQRIALVIGNSAYPEAPLKNPANDARAIAASLRARGFEVMVRENASKTQMEAAVADFGEKLTEGATALFFYAGHGMQVNGRNYLIPTSARITSEMRVRLEAFDVDAVLEQMQAARVKVSMVILDACRNNPFERRFRSVGGGLAQINAPEGTLIAYATAPGKVAADGDGANGLYTQELLKALNAPGLKVEDVFKQVRVNVSRVSSGGQVPWEASSLTGDFYFVPPLAAAAIAEPNPMIEMAFWDAVKNSTNPLEYRAYIDKYPHGNFTLLARTKMEALLGQRVAATPAPEPPRPAAASPVAAAPSQPIAQPEPGKQIAALPSPASGAIGQFDGRYRAELRTPRGTLEATLDIVGNAMSGFSQVPGGGWGASGAVAGLCRIRGILDAGGVIQRLEIDCPSFGGSFIGRAAVDPATGQLSVDTTVSGPSWNTARVVWKKG